VGVQRLAGQAPEPLLDGALPRRRLLQRRRAGDLVGDADREVVVPPQERERPAALGLGDRLRAEVRRADRVRVVHDVGPPVLVAADGQRQPEGEDQPDHAEQRALQGSHRLAVVVDVAEQAADDDAERGGAADHAEDQKRELPARQREEHGASGRYRGPLTALLRGSRR
jgi:hypothetical protein